MTVRLRTRVSTALMLAATLLQATIAPASADFPYFRLKSPAGQVIEPSTPPGQGQLSYSISGPSSGTIGQSYAATSKIAGASGTVSFTLSSGVLPPGVVLDATTGAVSGVPEQAGQFSAVLRAYDTGSATAATASLSVAVSPAFSLLGVPSGIATVGSPYSVQFNGNGGSTPYSFSTTSVLPPGLSLGATTGAVAGVPSQAGTYPNISISGRDAAGRTASSAPFTVVVSNPLSISWTAAAGRQGDNYSSAPSASGGHAPLFYVLNGTLPSGLSFSGSTGGITGTPTVSGEFSVQIAVGDQDGRVASTSYETISIAPSNVEQPLAIAGVPATDGQVDVAYSASFSATGGSSAGYVFDLVGSPLPEGLTLSVDGKIAGAPTVAGTFSGIQVRVTDSEAHSALSSIFSIIVAPAPALMISGNPSPSAQVGAAYSANFVAFEGSGSGYTFTSIGAPLPPGLELTKVSQAQANLMGTPAYVGTYSGLQVRVTDSAGHTADSSVFSITVAAPAGPALSFSGSPTTFATVGEAYSSSVSAGGGSGTGYSFTLASGSVLPAGLTLAPSGVISGTPSTPQSVTFSVQATDSVGDIGQASYTITVSAPLVFGGTPPDATQGASYLFGLTSITSKGRAPYSYALDSGALPSGMVLEDTSITSMGVSGSTSTAVIRVTDADGRAALGSLTFVVNPATATVVPGALVDVGGVGTVRAGNTIAGLLSTNIESPNWTFAQTPSSPAVAFGVSTDRRTFSAIAPNVTSPTDVTVIATATNGAAAQSAAPFTVRLLPELVVSRTGAGSLTGVVGTPFAYGPFSFSGVVGTPVLRPHNLQYSDGTMGDPLDIAAACHGLSVDTATGTISGVPSAACTVDIRMMLTDSYDGYWVVDGSGRSWPAHLDGSGSVYQTIADPAPAIQIVGATAGVTMTSAAHLRSGAGLSGTLTTNINSASWAFSSSPSGLTLSASTSAFSGVAPAVSSRTDYTVTASANAGAATANSQFQVSVAPQLSIAMNSASGTIGNAVSFAPSVIGVGGSASYALLRNGNVYSTLGTDCPGLAFSAVTGVVSGVPGGSCSVPNLSLRVTDDFDATSATSAAFQISIAGNTATASLNSGGEVRAGGAVTGTLSTDLPNASWSFSSTPAGLSLTASGSTFSGTAPSVGSQTTYSVTATATGGSYSASTSPFSLVVDPGLAVAGGPNGTVTGSVGVAIVTTAAPVPAGLIATASYQLLQAGSPYGGLNADCGLSFSTTTGQISGTPTKVCTVSGLTIRVTDSRDNATATTSTPFAVAVDTALIVSANPRTGAVSESYSYTPSASGGSGTYAAWSIANTSGSLGALGLSFNTATGAITGTPTSAGTWSGTISVTDSHGNVGTSGALSIAINSALSVVASPTSATIAVGETWGSGIVVTASGGYDTKTFSTVDTSGTLAALGLSFSPSNGSITGVPTTAGTWTGTIKVTDPGNVVGAQTASITITVNPALSVVPSTTSSTAAAGEPWSGITVTASGGAGAKTFSLVNSTGTLTALGLSFNGSTGAISGTPNAAGSWTGAVVVRDPGNTTGAATPTITITVNPALSIVAATSATAAVGESWTGISPNRTGGLAPFAFSAVNTSGTLSGLGLSVDPSTGAITGTPTAAGTWTGTIKVTDFGNPNGAQTAPITITVNSALAIASSWPASCTSGSQCSATFTASGGVPSAYAWTVPSTEGGYATSTANCTAASSTCTVKWTPTAAGTMSTTAIQVSDGSKGASSTTPSLTVAAGSGGGTYTLRTPTAVSTTFTYSNSGGANQANLYDGSDATPAADPVGLRETTMAAYDLGAAYDITRVRLITAPVNGFGTTAVFAIQYSDAGLNGPWTTANATITAKTGTSQLATTTFSSVGAHRYWRIAWQSSPDVGVNGWLGELGFYSSP